MPSEMRSVLSLVKSLGDLPNVLYVLAFDEAVVKEALRNSSEKLDETFLEKIVQVSLKLPPPWGGELRQLLFTRLNALFRRALPNDADRWQRILFDAIGPYLETPRDVTRLANTLQVIWPNVEGDVDLADLVTITTLQLFDPKVYNLIQNQIESITRSDLQFEDDKQFGERMEPTFARKPEVAKKAMAHLFPRLDEIWNKLLAESSLYLVERDHRRICTKEYHRNYFLYGRDSRMLDRAEIDGILTSADPAASLRKTLAHLLTECENGKHSRIGNFLNQLTEAVYNRGLLRESLVRAILDQANILIVREEESYDLFRTDNLDRLRLILLFGLEKLNSDERHVILDVLLNYKLGLHLRARIILDDVDRHGLFDGKAEHESRRIFSADRIEQAAVAMRDELAQACENPTVWDGPLPICLVWSWKHLGGGKRLTDWINRVIADDELIVRLAHEIPHRSYRSSGYTHTSVVMSFTKSQWASLLDIDEVYSRLETLAESNQAAADTLRRLRDADDAGRTP
jgi:hypothetical protein